MDGTFSSLREKLSTKVGKAFESENNNEKLEESSPDTQR